MKKKFSFHKEYYFNLFTKIPTTINRDGSVPFENKDISGTYELVSMHDMYCFYSYKTNYKVFMYGNDAEKALTEPVELRADLCQ